MEISSWALLILDYSWWDVEDMVAYFFFVRMIEAAEQWDEGEYVSIWFS